MKSALLSVLAVAAALTACGSDGGQPLPSAAAATSEHEEIYVFRTHRTSRTPGGTSNCDAAPFTVRQEDYYDLFAPGFDESRGLVTDPSATPVPGFIACLGEITPEGSFAMYSIGRIADRGSYTGLNSCQIVGVDEPAAGALLLVCQGRLQQLPEGYVGGFLTSSTLSPRGEGSDVPGYTATSIVTLRLWKR